MSKPRYQKFLTHLEAEIAAHEAFQDYLAQELTALEQNQLDIFETLQADKSKHIDTINQLGNQRLDMLVQAHIDASPESVETWLVEASDPLSSQLLTLWRRCKSIFEETKRKNIINGCVIVASYQQSVALFNQLCGSKDHSKTYDKRGVTTERQRTTRVTKI